MRTLLNIIWVVFGGFWLFLSYLFFGVIACLLIVTIPEGVASFRIAAYVLWPFGREVVPAPGAGAMSGISNIIWFLVAGLWLAIGHLPTAAAQANAAALNSASMFEIDDVIDPAETRSLIAATLATAEPAGLAPRRGFVDTW